MQSNIWIKVVASWPTKPASPDLIHSQTSFVHSSPEKCDFSPASSFKYEGMSSVYFQFHQTCVVINKLTKDVCSHSVAVY